MVVALGLDAQGNVPRLLGLSLAELGQGLPVGMDGAGAAQQAGADEESGPDASLA